IAHQKVIEVAQRLGADASLPKSRLDDGVAAHIRQELAPPKESAHRAEPSHAAPHQASPKAPPQAPKKTRASAPAKVEAAAAVSKTSRTTRSRRTAPASAKPEASTHEAAARETASKDGAPHRKSSSQVVIIDVSNVAREECDAQGRAKLESFLHLLAQLERG